MPLGGLCIASMDKRSDIRHRYHIDRNRFTDCLSHTFCTPCALTQESREIALEEIKLTVPWLEMCSEVCKYLVVVVQLVVAAVVVGTASTRRQ